jgi:pimeloyl-ACP methyl ester carboxylesterase
MNWREFQGLQKLVEVGDRFISYVDRGAGDPVVLLHGFPSWSYLWHDLISILSRTHRVLAPDLLGFGYSERSDRFDRSIAQQAEALDLWMERIGVPKAALIGHDIGGGVALRLAIFHARRVTSLCLMNSVAYDSWPVEEVRQLGQPGAASKLSASALQSILRRMLRKGFHTLPPRALLDGLLAPWSTEVGKLSLIRSAAALNTNQTVELTPLLQRIEVPALIVWGQEDCFQPLRYGERLAWDIPQAELISVLRARHFVMLEQPEVVAAHVAELLGPGQPVGAVAGLGETGL